MACCLANCSCPSGDDCGALWKKIKIQPCCVCPLDNGSNCATLSPAKPHRKSGCCECECNEALGGKVAGSCPSTSPDWDSKKCKCHCALIATGCPKNKKLNTSTCKCDCILEEKNCKAPNPSLDSVQCKCVPCNKSQSSCPPSAPTLHNPTCTCRCQYNKPGGGNSCPINTPTLDTATCTCKCNLTAASCPNGQYFDSRVCSCKRCTNVCKPGQTFGSGCACVGCPVPKLQCANGSCINPCPPNTRNKSYTFNRNSCSCDYNVTGLAFVGKEFLP